jgi:predicted NACHT family NTPase
VPLRGSELSDDTLNSGRSRRVPLDSFLDRRLLAVVGGAGSGKTTFLRHVVLSVLAGRATADEPALAALAGTEPLPFLIRAANFDIYLSNRTGAQDATLPATTDSPAWLTHYLAAVGRERQWELPRSYLEEQLRKRPCAVLIDALDEVTGQPARERLAAIVSNAATDFPGCRFLLTCRPNTLPGTLLPDFARVSIAGLGSREIRTFLQRWAERCYPSESRSAQDYLRLINEALLSGETRALARNPILLTALAIVHREEKRLPQRRTKLYHFLVDWTLRSREQTGARIPAELAFHALRASPSPCRATPRDV